MSSKFAQELEQAVALYTWLRDSEKNDLHLKNDSRHRAAGVCFDVAREHHLAILQLLDRTPSLHVSAVALVRPLFDAYVRGMWLWQCASDEQLEKYLQKSKLPDMRSLIKAVEGASDMADEGSGLRMIYEESWPILSGFTHAGAEFVHRYSVGPTLEPDFSEEELCRAVRFVSRIGLVTAVSMAHIAGDLGRASELLDEGVKRLPQSMTP
jgi:hypothetical protein